MKELKLCFRDWVWVINAYLRGKLLRQKAFCPQKQGNLYIFRITKGATFKRQTALIKMWSGRLMTVEEVFNLQTTVEPDQQNQNILCLNFEDGEIEFFDWLNGSWPNIGIASSFMPKQL